MVYIIGCLIIIIGFLGIKLFQKQKIDKQELNTYNTQVKEIRNKINEMQATVNAEVLRYEKYKQRTEAEKEKAEYEQYKLEECKKDLQAALDVYNDITENKLKEIDATIEEQRRKRQEELDNAFNETKAKYDLWLKEYTDQRQKQAEEIRDQCIEAEEQNLEESRKIKEQTQRLREVFEGIERTLRMYDAEQQAKLFYTIQLPEEYHDDIDFLLTTVAQKVTHPDIISKLVWAEYVKPNLDNTFKRIEIKSDPGIYKLTSLQNGKCYIGKSTNVKNRIADHFKSSIGIRSIADQAVHHAILKEGFWNWQIEVITYCEKDQLNELEKYYIEFFKAQEYGYNRTQGG